MFEEQIKQNRFEDYRKMTCREFTRLQIHQAGKVKKINTEEQSFLLYYLDHSPLDYQEQEEVGIKWKKLLDKC